VAPHTTDAPTDVATEGGAKAAVQGDIGTAASNDPAEPVAHDLPLVSRLTAKQAAAAMNAIERRAENA